MAETLFELFSWAVAAAVGWAVGWTVAGLTQSPKRFSALAEAYMEHVRNGPPDFKPNTVAAHRERAAVLWASVPKSEQARALTELRKFAEERERELGL